MVSTDGVVDEKINVYNGEKKTLGAVALGSLVVAGMIAGGLVFAWTLMFIGEAMDKLYKTPEPEPLPISERVIIALNYSDALDADRGS